MRKRLVSIVILTVATLLFAVSAQGQGGAKQGPTTGRDPDMEQEGLHNLEVARQYFKLRKAYVASLERCEEVLAGNPTFSKLADAKGKQKPDQYVIREGEKKTTLTPQDFREKARDYLSQLVNDYPQSKFRDEALNDLKSLGGPKPKQAAPSPETTTRVTQRDKSRSKN